MLHFVGSSQGQSKLEGYITSQQAQYGATKRQSLIRLYRGVYCEDEDLQDLPDFLRRNALRIANYLYQGAALSHSSAYYKGPVESDAAAAGESKHKLFLAGSYMHKIEIGFQGHLLEVVQSDTLKNARINPFCLPITDNRESIYGPVGLTCLNDEVVFLQQFGRRRYNLERFLSDQALEKLSSLLVQRHGEALEARLMMVASQAGDFSAEIAGALGHLRARNSTQRLGGGSSRQEEPVNNVFEFVMGWYRRPIGRITYNGVSWNFSYDDGWCLPLSVGKVKPGVMPPFVHNLFPEGYLLDAMNDAMGSGTGFGATIMSQSERYLANIAIVNNAERLKRIPLDVLSGRLRDFNDELCVFRGDLTGMPDTSPEFIGQLNRILTDIRMPRESGNQPKIPCFLDEQGRLVPAMDQPFTHIVKLAGLYKDPHYLRGAVEWASMLLARGGGVKTCDFSLLEMGNGALAYVCERFDIPQSEEDMRLIYAEDFCSVHSKGPMFKMLADDGLESLISAYREHATPHREDAEQLFRQAYANYILENGDFHLKNASLIRVASPTLDSFRSTRLAPAYDIMNTRFFSDFPKPPELRESMVLEFRSKNIDFILQDYHNIGQTLDIAPARVEQLLSEVAHGIAAEARRVAYNLPEMLDAYPKAREVVAEVLERAVRFCHQDFPDIPLLTVPPSSARAANDAEAPAAAAKDNELLAEIRRTLRRP